MSLDQARESIIDGMNYAAYKETNSSLYDSDKNLLFGSAHYKSSRLVVSTSPWEGPLFEEKMATSLRWANFLNESQPAFRNAQELLKDERSLLGGIIRRCQPEQPSAKSG